MWPQQAEKGQKLKGGSSAHYQEAPNWVMPSNPLHTGELFVAE